MLRYILTQSTLGDIHEHMEYSCNISSSPTFELKHCFAKFQVKALYLLSSILSRNVSNSRFLSACVEISPSWDWAEIWWVVIVFVFIMLLMCELICLSRLSCSPPALFLRDYLNRQPLHQFSDLYHILSVKKGFAKWKKIVRFFQT